jgi:hypothetical protein
MDVGLRNPGEFRQAPFGQFPVAYAVAEHSNEIVLQFSE